MGKLRIRVWRFDIDLDRPKEATRSIRLAFRLSTRNSSPRMNTASCFDLKWVRREPVRTSSVWRYDLRTSRVEGSWSASDFSLKRGIAESRQKFDRHLKWHLEETQEHGLPFDDLKRSCVLFNWRPDRPPRVTDFLYPNWSCDSAILVESGGVRIKFYSRSSRQTDALSITYLHRGQIHRPRRYPP